MEKLNQFNVKELTLEEMSSTDGGAALFLAAVALGFAIGCRLWPK